MISLCMIVRDEEQFLEKCLISAKSCVDEMIVVDTGSTDHTVQIASEMGAKIFHYEWNDDFGAARNFSADQASGDWILYLDADEELQPGCCDRLRTLAGIAGVEGYYFQINNLSDGSETLRHINLRMFRNRSEYRFEGRLHEQIVNVIMENNPQAALMISGINILHYGYLASVFTAKDKARRNLAINKKLVEEQPDNPFYLYNLGNTLINFNDIEKAAEAYHHSLENINPKAHFAPSVFLGYIRCLTKLGKFDEAVEYIDKCKSHYPDFVDLYYVEGELFAGLGHLQKARQSFERCLGLGEQASGRYVSATGVGSFLSMFQLAQIHRTLGHAEKALSYQLQGLKIANRNLPQFIALAHILKDVLKDGQKVLAAFAGMRPSNQTVQHLLVARLLYEIEEYGLALVVLDQSPVITDETWYRRGQTLLKLHRYSEALQCFRQITGVSPIYTRCVQDMVLAGWLNTPPVNAGELIQPQNFSDPQLYQVLQSINNQLFAGGSAEIDVNSVCLQRIVGMLLSLNEVGPVLKIMALCGLEKPNDQIVFLTNGPAEIASACLAAKLALLEIKRGNVHPDFFYVLSWYLFLNDELKTSQDTLRIAASLNPESSQYRNLLQAIYQRQLEKMVLAALERYPDNRQLNHRLIVIKVGSSKDIRLKGAY